MSKIEETLNVIKERNDRMGSDPSMVRRHQSRLWTRRRMSEENEGAEWIEKLRVEPVLDLDNDESRVVLSDAQDESVRSAYKMLRTRTVRRMRSNDWQTLGITSATQGDGKSLTSLNLALSLARETTLSVVLLELDLRRPTICRQLGVEPRKGLPDYLDGTSTLEEVMFRPQNTKRLAILPNTEVYENSSEVLSSPKIAQLIEELRTDDPGRMLVCDLPPFMVADDVLAFAPLVDAFLLVVSEGVTSRQTLHKGLDILQELPVLGVVLNRSEEVSGGYYYY
jgi:capsular exopolysaccharide synthesis family protein